MVVPQPSPDTVSQQSVPTVQTSTSGGVAVAPTQASVPGEAEGGKAKSLLKLLPYDGTESLRDILG